GQGETGKPDGKANTKPEKKGGDDGQSSEKKQGGMGNNGESGSGRESKDKSGAAQAQETNTDRAKQQRPDDQKAADSQEAQSPSGSKKQSDSQGSEGGDRSGGGKKGPGQGANAAGNDKAGSNNPADEGAGTAKETGMGETGTKGGDQKRTDEKTGSAGTEEGDGSSTQKDPRGNKPGQEPLKGEPAPMGDQPPQSPQASAEKPSQGGQKGPVTGGGLPGEQGGDSPLADAEAPAAEAAKIDYARQATDLVLDYLKDQKEQPDQQLLDELGWSKEDLKQFLSRWEAAQREAKADPNAKQELDEALRSLGLRPRADTLRRGATRSDNQRGLGDVNNATGAPPSKYLEQFKAFKKGAARGK
ncbi:MAG TPA: hypothetical protein VL096_22045, partial [Pirellulaceae bacterium]|nr:hypothetical protein [Pirellulaceae bacterium]